VADTQVVPSITLGATGAGSADATPAHELPFHPSTSVWSTPSIPLAEYPAAAHSEALGHETDSRALACVLAVFGVLVKDHDVPL
jgi:hypothetical protein